MDHQPLCALGEVQLVVDARGPLFAVVTDEDEGLVGTTAEGLDEAEDEVAAAVVKAVERLVEDEKVGVFDKGTGHEHQALFATRHTEEGTVGQMVDTEESHPPETLLALLGRGTDVETDGVLEAAGHDMEGGEVAVVAAVHLGRHVAYAPLDVPDAHAGIALTVAEEADVAGIALWVVGTDERQQRRLAGTVLARECPVLTLADGPVEVAQDGAVAVADGHVVEGDDFFRGER